jgi:hypothetical protein
LFPSILLEFDMVDTLTHDGLKTCLLLILYGSTLVQLITIHSGDPISTLRKFSIHMCVSFFVGNFHEPMILCLLNSWMKAHYNEHFGLS